MDTVVGTVTECWAELLDVRLPSPGYSLGTMTVLMYELPALTSRRANAEGVLYLEVKSTSTSDMHQSLQAIYFIAQP